MMTPSLLPATAMMLAIEVAEMVPSSSILRMPTESPSLLFVQPHAISIPPPPPTSTDSPPPPPTSTDSPRPPPPQPPTAHLNLHLHRQPTSTSDRTDLRLKPPPLLPSSHLPPTHEEPPPLARFSKFKFPPRRTSTTHEGPPPSEYNPPPRRTQ
ncbi:extensin-like [Helianthus annuus]|uniref:extensin-like n=1 Tax=Helianthus annuus TaxID=4232 RepID=UPI000B8F3C2C|nr:extensin-like [Helianthus annuus]